ncbi:MAG: glycosyltransferase family 2 protein [Acidobacteria bacterium]|nr:glycosyltransferase family 2 protein [Acidobacteriota bacterium]
MKTPLSVLILTRDEAANIAACLESLRWADEVFVVDSLSRDRTVEIAKGLGARVYPHPFEGFAKQRNWALDNLPFAHEWVLALDADEQVPPALAEEISRTLRDPQAAHTGYYLKRRIIFQGRRLHHGGLYPVWILRLFRREAGRFEDRPMNEHVVLRGAAGYLKHPFDHRSCPSLSDWIAKHNTYADLMAEEYECETSGAGYRDSIPASLWGGQVERKRWMKLHFWNRFPLLGRAFLNFARNYIIRGGFLDGRPGFIFHVLWSFWFPFLIDAKILERRMGGAVPETLPHETLTSERRASEEAPVGFAPSDHLGSGKP